MIDWKEVSDKYGLSVSQFKIEVFTAAASIAAISLDRESGDSDAVRFTCSDGVGKLELTVKRIGK